MYKAQIYTAKEFLGLLRKKYPNVIVETMDTDRTPFRLRGLSKGEADQFLADYAALGSRNNFYEDGALYCKMDTLGNCVRDICRMPDIPNPMVTTLQDIEGFAFIMQWEACPESGEEEDEGLH